MSDGQIAADRLPSIHSIEFNLKKKTHLTLMVTSYFIYRNNSQISVTFEKFAMRFKSQYFEK